MGRSLSAALNAFSYRITICCFVPALNWDISTNFFRLSDLIKATFFRASKTGRFSYCSMFTSQQLVLGFNVCSFFQLIYLGTVFVAQQIGSLCIFQIDSFQSKFVMLVTFELAQNYWIIPPQIFGCFPVRENLLLLMFFLLWFFQ